MTPNEIRAELIENTVIPLIQQMSKRPNTHWGDIVRTMQTYANAFRNISEENKESTLHRLPALEYRAWTSMKSVPLNTVVDIWCESVHQNELPRRFADVCKRDDGVFYFVIGNCISDVPLDEKFIPVSWINAQLAPTRNDYLIIDSRK